MWNTVIFAEFPSHVDKFLKLWYHCHEVTWIVRRWHHHHVFHVYNALEVHGTIWIKCVTMKTATWYEIWGPQLHSRNKSMAAKCQPVTGLLRHIGNWVTIPRRTFQDKETITQDEMRLNRTIRQRPARAQEEAVSRQKNQSDKWKRKWKLEQGEKSDCNFLP